MGDASPFFRHVLITGASSGIGEALALAYAATGTTLSLCGRDSDRLSAVAAACRSNGAAASTHQLDVTDAAATERWVKDRDNALPLDLVVANAGLSAGSGATGETAAQTRRIFSVNIDGVVNTVLPAVDVMAKRKHGHIAIMSFLAGFRGIGGAPAYCASKAAVRVWGEALRGALARDNVHVSVICPGFVQSRMTAVNRFHMPFFMDAPKAARIIQRGIAANKGRIAFPWPMAALVWLLAALPDGVANAIARVLPAKEHAVT